jgi:hypothetical protein
MTKNTTKTWRTNMKIKEKLYIEKCLKREATGIHYKVDKIKPNYSLRFALQHGGMAMAL